MLNRAERRSVAMAALAVLLVACAAEGDFRASNLAVTQAHRDGVPQLARSGKRLPAYDPGQSFFPLGLYNVVHSDRLGGAIDFAGLKDAGFNTVVAAPDQPLLSFATEAARHGLQIVGINPKEDDLTSLARSPAVLAWLLETEPSLRGREGENRRRMEAFRERRLAMRSRDPDRPAMLLDVPLAEAADRGSWTSWRREADLSVVTSYPFRRGPVSSLEGPAGPAGVVADMLGSDVTKPAIAMLQAFAMPLQGWYMPSPDAARTSAYAALVQGATGLIWFSHDSYFSRNLGTLGIAPAPAGEYPVVQPLPGSLARLRVRGEQVEESSRLWREVAALNREIAELTPSLLRPTSSRGYSVEIRGAPGQPVRSLLKDEGETLLLISVNLGNMPLDVRFAFESDLLTVTRLFSAEAAPGGSKRGWTDSFPPFAVRIYRLRPVSTS